MTLSILWLTPCAPNIGFPSNRSTLMRIKPITLAVALVATGFLAMQAQA